MPRRHRVGVLVNDVAVALLHRQRRIDPYVRPAFDRTLRPVVAAAVQALINARREDDGLALAEERHLADEDELIAAIIDHMSRFTRRTYPQGPALRAGNTKTYGAVRATFTVGQVPGRYQRGLFAEPASYRAWVRFSGPGPLAPPDMEDNGVLSVGVKVMGVPGPKFLDDERHTQDFTGISAPTFTTPDIAANLQLQRNVGAGTPVLYFLGPSRSHILDGIMQGLWSKTHGDPLDARYYSCVPYLLGEGTAIQYSLRPRSPARTRAPRRPHDDYLRQAMVRRLAGGPVDFDLLVQEQTDPHRMPIEDASVRWPERRSRFVPVARLHIPAQRFDSDEQLAFAEALSFNPWHALPEHRPLGNQNRARRAIYQELSRLRHTLNATPATEPTGDEVFPTP